MDRTKYPRTFNLPWSQSNSSDDVWWKDTHVLDGVEVVITEKLDGECTTIYPDSFTHARSVDSKHHESRSLLKNFAAQICHMIPNGYRLCGENVYAFHSILYTELPDYFLPFGLYDDKDMCSSWDDLTFLCEALGLKTVPVIYRGLWDEKSVRNLWQGKGAYPTFEAKKSDPKFPDDFQPCSAEGYVVRPAAAFHYDEFSKWCAKFVRENHVKTSEHWLTQAIIPNRLATDR